MTPHATKKYLEHYAEAESSLAQTLCHNYDNVLCIPAHREDAASLRRMLAPFSGNLLAILVVNTPDTADRETRALLDDLQAEKETWRAGNMSLHQTDGPDLLVVDRCSPGRTLARRKGVGHARKIAADLALALIAQGRLAAPLIHNTDADVHLPDNYFEPGLPRDCAALVYPFRHASAPGLELAACLYEISMFYYVAGLRWAGSPWAYTTVGSTIAVSAEHYAVVRGFPKRSAGEDFYLLNKLAKTGSIRQLERPELVISARPSDRVPFGTGPGISRIAALDDPPGRFRFYHPGIFQELRAWQSLLATAEAATYPELSPPLDAWWEAAELSRVWARLAGNARSTETFRRSLQAWFDAFRTLKFVHFMRDHYYPSVDFTGLVAAPFTPDATDPASVRNGLAADCFDDSRFGMVP